MAVRRSVYYKIRTSDTATLRRVLGLLTGRAEVLGVSEKRHFISTGSLSSKVRHEVEANGARVTVDEQYELER
jgi:hypothetical protein